MTDSEQPMIDRYRIESKLGAGGMADVYKAFDTRLERYVALKVITDTRQNSDKFLKRFEREAKSLAKLSHPNIVDVHDYGESQGHPYIVMTYLPNGTLKKFMGQPIHYQQAARLLIPIANALGYAHSQGVVHRDIKPANILLTEQDIPMVSDFGIAKVLTTDTEEALTQVGTGIGTPSYMSPEQGQGREIDARTDVYALGVVFYEMLTGAKPYEATTPTGVFWKQMTEPLPDPRKIVPDLPEAIVVFLQKAMSPDVNTRVQSMKEFSDSLEVFANGFATAGYKEPETSRVDRASATVIDNKTQSEEFAFPQSIQTPNMNAVYNDDVNNLPPAGAMPNAAPKKKKKTWIIFAVIGALLFVGVLCVGGIILFASLPDTDPTEVLTADVAISQPEIETQNETEIETETEQQPQPTLAPETNNADNSLPETMIACVQSAGSSQYTPDLGYRPIFCDTFDDNHNQWSLRSVDTDYALGTASMQNGVFRLELTARQEWAQYWIWLNNAQNQENLPAGNFVMEYKIRKVSGSADTFVGVDYRETENDQFYSVTVYENSDLVTLEFYDSETYTTLEDLDLTDWSDTGWNTITVAATGPNHGVTVNGQLLESQNNTILEPGSISLWIGVINTGESAIYEIDDVVVYRIDN